MLKTLCMTLVLSQTILAMEQTLYGMQDPDLKSEMDVLRFDTKKYQSSPEQIALTWGEMRYSVSKLENGEWKPQGLLKGRWMWLAPDASCSWPLLKNYPGAFSANQQLMEMHHYGKRDWKCTTSWNGGKSWSRAEETDISSSDLTFLNTSTMETMKIHIEYLHGEETCVKRELADRKTRVDGMVHYSTWERTGTKIQNKWTEVEFRMVTPAQLRKLLNRTDGKQLDKVIDQREYPALKYLNRRELKDFGQNRYELQFDTGNGLFEDVKDTMLSILVEYTKANKTKVASCIRTLTQKTTYRPKFNPRNLLKHTIFGEWRNSNKWNKMEAEYNYQWSPDSDSEVRSRFD